MDVEQMPVEKAEEDANATGLLERGYLQYDVLITGAGAALWPPIAARSLIAITVIMM